MLTNTLSKFNIAEQVPTEILLTVNTYDIDVAGHVNNIVYIRWLEDLRNNFFSKTHPMELILKANHYLFVVSCDVKYKKQIKLFDKPVGKMFLQNHSHGLFTLKAEIIINNHIAFSAIQKCVFVNLSNNKMFTGNVNELITNL